LTVIKAGDAVLIFSRLPGLLTQRH
jgi:hypothetical protein